MSSLTYQHPRARRAAPAPSKAARLPKVDTFDSVFDAIADTPHEAANLRARAELLGQIVKLVKDSGMPKGMAASVCQISGPRMSDLMLGRISLFSLDALVNIASQLGTVRVKLQHAV